MNLDLASKRVLVTGSTSGIGEAIARRFAQEGATVIIHGRREEAAERVAAEIRRDGGKAIVALGDLSQDEDVTRIVDTALAKLGGVDILVNNAAKAEHQNDMETAPADWLASYNTNLLSMVRLVQHLLPPMEEQGWGRIISISSGAAVMPSPGMGVYATTKAAMNSLTVSLAQGIKNDGVTVNTVSPGAIITEKQIEMGRLHGMGDTREEVEAALNGMVASTPFGRMGRVEEVAAVVVFLASPLAGYVHGANIRVDGGYVPTVN